MNLWNALTKWCCAPGPVTGVNACCSFCLKSRHEVGPLVEGPNRVFICDTCIDLSRSILDQEKLRRSYESADLPGS
jgi:hypothetical protein